MKISKLLSVSYLLYCLAFCLPWFSMNPKVCGYTWGFQLGLYFLLPMVLLCTVLLKGRERLGNALAFAGSLLNFPVIILLWGRYNVLSNIKSGWEFELGVPRYGFYVSLLLFLQMSIVLGIRLFGVKKAENG